MPHVIGRSRYARATYPQSQGVGIGALSPQIAYKSIDAAQVNFGAPGAGAFFQLPENSAPQDPFRLALSTPRTGNFIEINWSITLHLGSAPVVPFALLVVRPIVAFDDVPVYPGSFSTPNYTNSAATFLETPGGGLFPRYTMSGFAAFQLPAVAPRVTLGLDASYTESGGTVSGIVIFGGELRIAEQPGAWGVDIPSAATLTPI